MLSQANDKTEWNHPWESQLSLHNLTAIVPNNFTTITISHDEARLNQLPALFRTYRTVNFCE